VSTDTQARLLVVDDDAAARRMMRRLLERRGFAVFEVDNGEAAIEACHEHDPDCVLMDLRMPGELSGTDAIDQMRLDPRIAETPIIVVSASVHHAGDGTALGADGFVAKPVDFDELLATIDRVLVAADRKG
jgi:CheY-like chemotaxis protein